MRGLRLVLLAALAAPGVVAAAPLEVELSVAGAVGFQGEGMMAWVATGAMLDFRDGPPEGALEVTGAIAYQVVEFNVTRMEAPDGSVVGRREVEQASGRAVVASGRAASLQAVPASDASSLRLIGETRLAGAGGFRVQAPVEVAPHYLAAGDPEASDATPAAFPSGGGRLDRATVRGSCDCRVVAYGAHVLLDGAPLATGVVGTTTTPDPLGQGSVTVERRRILQADGQGLAVIPSGPSWVVFVQRFDGVLEGDLEIHDARGRGTVNGTEVPDRPHLFQAIGALETSGEYGPAGSTWTVRGEPAFVAVNTAPVWGERPGTAAAIVAIGGLAALAVAVAKYGRLALAAIPGLNVADPLGHGRRVELLGLIARSPGIGQSELATRAATARPVVRHHLRILGRAGLITERAVQNRSTYTLNDDSFEFPVGLGDRASAVTTGGRALAEFHQPVRRAVLDALTALGQATYAEMADWWGRMGRPVPAPEVVSRHCTGLHRRGLLQRTRLGKSVAWRLGFDHGRVERHAGRSFLVKGSLLPIVEALGEGPDARTVQEIEQSLRRRGHRLPRRALEPRLRLLEAVGYVNRTPDGYLATPPSRPSIAVPGHV